jgi:hypothetical protein
LDRSRQTSLTTLFFKKAKNLHGDEYPAWTAGDILEYIWTLAFCYVYIHAFFMTPFSPPSRWCFIVGELAHDDYSTSATSTLVHRQQAPQSCLRLRRIDVTSPLPLALALPAHGVIATNLSDGERNVMVEKDKPRWG